LTIAAATGVGRYFQRSLMIRASRKCEFDLRNDYFRHVQRLGQDFFHRTKTGDIMAAPSTTSTTSASSSGRASWAPGTWSACPSASG